MGFNEFKELSQVLNGWKTTFSSYDQDRSGTVEGRELQMALTSMGEEEGAAAAMERAHSPAQHALPPSDSTPCVCLSVFRFQPEPAGHERGDEALQRRRQDRLRRLHQRLHQTASADW